MTTGNKGEWSEIYVFFKILIEKSLSAADENLNPIPSIKYPILSVYRNEGQQNIEYNLIASDPEKIRIIVNGDESRSLELECASLREILPQFLKTIQLSSGSFECPIVMQHLKECMVRRLTVGSDQTADLDVKIHDSRTQDERRVGFSVKSKIGSPATLFNACGDSTNFIFQIKGIDASEIKKINAINPTRGAIRSRIDKIKELGGVIHFHSMGSEVFRQNLTMIDSGMPEILATMIRLYFESSYSSVQDILKELIKNNPLNVRTSGNVKKLYEHKTKQLLIDFALGLRSGREWNGVSSASGGYVVLKDDGSIVCFYIYDYEHLKRYLINNTKFDTPSTTRHKYGSLYENNHEIYLKLNFQIRFLQ